MTQCNNCILSDEDPGVNLDAGGECNWCKWQREMEEKYPKNFINLDSDLKYLEGGGEYDVIVGISGGVDSSYLLMKCIDWGLKPLAVTFDDGWNTRKAQDNIRKLVDKLDVDLKTYVVDYEEMNNIYKAFIINNLPDTDAPTDVAIAKIQLEATRKSGIKYSMDAHNFRTEGTTPLEWLYFDGKYVRDVAGFNFKKSGVKEHGFPNLSMWDMIGLGGITRLRPLYIMNYSRDNAAKELKERIGWTKYKLHHGENLWTVFSNYVWMYEKFHLDLRKVFLSAQVRSGLIGRDSAIEQINKPPLEEKERRLIVNEVEERLEVDVEELLLNGKRRHYTEFKTYKTLFKRTWPLWWAMMKLGRVPDTFYYKYVRG